MVYLVMYAMRQDTGTEVHGAKKAEPSPNTINKRRGRIVQSSGLLPLQNNHDDDNNKNGEKRSRLAVLHNVSYNYDDDNNWASILFSFFLFQSNKIKTWSQLPDITAPLCSPAWLRSGPCPALLFRTTLRCRRHTAHRPWA